MRLVETRNASSPSSILPGHADAVDPKEARVVAVVSAGCSATEVLEEARRLADAFGVGWTALHIVTPLGPSSAEAAEALTFAGSLGAEVSSIPAGTEVDGIAASAGGASHIVIGAPAHASVWRPRLSDQLRAALPHASIVLVPCETEAAPRAASGSGTGEPHRTAYLAAIGAVAATIPLVLLLRSTIGPQGLALLFLLPVIPVAARYGVRASILSSLLSAAAYDIFVLKPAFSLTLAAPQDLLVLGTLLALGISTSVLTGRLRARAILSDRSAQENAALAALALSLTKASDWGSTAEALSRDVAALLDVEAAVLREVEGKLIVAGAFPQEPVLDPLDRAALDWAWSRGTEAGSGTATLAEANWQFHPLKTSLGILAVLGLARTDGQPPVHPHKKVLLATIIAQAALAHERLRLEDDMRCGPAAAASV
ncbi:DUF4118 domain-containing protein [Sphingomonas parva]|uniref:DUF4118 domain-containing protein n=1 Tax=Sphingomonas parva TaxID=2555898 RepID=A0A4Y8ZPM9_9SPHN|nr:DUF4118 domain-containing protein [Sphingomonas parva]TFI56416.1 DUF4118 domain-containing protein [Sphingomonas parva]